MKKTGKPVLILLFMLSILTIFPNDCFSVNWVYLTSSKMGDKWYIDVDSIKVNTKKKQFKVRIKIVYKNNNYNVVYNLMDYDNNIVYFLSNTMYDHSGYVIKSFDYEPSETRTYIPPGIMFHAILDFVMEIEGLK